MNRRGSKGPEQRASRSNKTEILLSSTSNPGVPTSLVFIRRVSLQQRQNVTSNGLRLLDRHLRSGMPFACLVPPMTIASQEAILDAIYNSSHRPNDRETHRDHHPTWSVCKSLNEGLRPVITTSNESPLFRAGGTRGIREQLD